MSNPLSLLSRAVLLCSVAGAACADPLSAELLRHQRDLQFALRAHAAGPATVASSDEVVLDGAAVLAQRAGSDPALQRKASELRHLADVLAAVRAGQAMQPQLLEQEGPRVELADDGSLGARCDAPLALTGDRTTAVALGAHGGRDRVWLRWRAPAPGHYRITTRGSALDSVLSAYADCADAGAGAAPRLRNDDAFGLDAELVLHADAAGETLWIAADNLGDAGTLLVKSTVTTTISGRVTSAIDGTPLGNYRIEAYTATDGYAGGTYTDAQGNYTISPYDYGVSSYYVRTLDQSRDRRYVDEAWSDAQCVVSNYAGSVQSCTGAVLVALRPGNQVTGIDFALSTGAQISGRVIDAVTGAGIKDAQVEIWSGQVNLRVTTTDEAGRYSIGALAHGTYYIAAIAADHAGRVYGGAECVDGRVCDPRGGTAIAVSGPVGHIDVDLQPRSYLDIGVSIDGVPYQGWYAAFAVYHPNGALALETQGSSSAGRYKIGPLEPGAYVLASRVDGATFRQVMPGIDCADDCTAERAGANQVTIARMGDRPRIDVDLHRLPRIVGRITDAATGQPLASSTARLYRVDYSGSHAYSAAADADGLYALGAVAPGRYYLHVGAPRYVDALYPDLPCEVQDSIARCAAGTAIAVGVGSGDQVFDVALDRGIVVTGTITVDHRRIPDGSWGEVSLLNNSGGTVRTASIALNGVTGAYVLSDFPAGTYFLGARLDATYNQVFDGVNCPLSSPYWYDGCPLGRARAMTLTTADAVADFDLRSYGTRLARVRDRRSGAPLEGIAIDMWNTQGLRIGSFVSGTDGTAIISTGRYASSAEVRLSTDNYAGYVDQVYPGRDCVRGTSVYRGTCGLDGATTITLPAPSADMGELVFSLDGSNAVFSSGFE